MSRKKKWTIRKWLKITATKRLHRMLAIGESRHEAKRQKTAAQKIFSYETYHTYLRVVLCFIDYCCRKFHVTSLEECGEYALIWINERVEKVSIPTAAKERSALRKLFQGQRVTTPDLPPCRVTDITLNRNPATWADFPEARHEELVQFCLATGLRRRELHLLRGTDLTERQGTPFIAVDRGAKGGRKRYVEIQGNEETVQTILARMAQAGPGKVFPHVPDNAPIHHYRALYAVQVYLKYAKTLEECRGRKYWNKNRYKAQGQAPGVLQSRVFRYRREDRRGCWLDKVAMQKAALNLGHNRISVFARSYEYPLFQKVTTPFEEQLLAQSGLQEPDFTRAGERFRLS